MNTALRVLLIADSFKIFSSAMFGPIYAIFVEEIGGGVLEASWSIAVFTFVTGVTMFILSKFEDGLTNKRYAIALGYALLALSYFMYIFVDSLTLLLIVQLLSGIAVAIGTPAFDGLYSQHLDKNKEASGWGSWEVMASFVAAGGAILGGLLASLIGFWVLFVSMGIFCLLASAVLIRHGKTL